jgi:hypothetical protein
LTTKPWIEKAGADVLNEPFFAENNIATAGGGSVTISQTW